MQTIKVDYYWDTEDRGDPHIKIDKRKKKPPFLQSSILVLPHQGQNVSLDLPTPKNCEIVPARTVVHGIVKAVTKAGTGHYQVVIERYKRSGLDLGTVYAHKSGAVIIGFHPLLGRIKGEVLEISIEMELVKIQMENGGPDVWVSWTALCTQGEEIVQQTHRRLFPGNGTPRMIPKLV